MKNDFTIGKEQFGYARDLVKQPKAGNRLFVNQGPERLGGLHTFTFFKGIGRPMYASISKHIITNLHDALTAPEFQGNATHFE